MAPLDDIATAAAHIAVGGLETRLPATDDPDLAVIVGSFNSMVEALDERIRRDARFAADLGHELRSPLTTLVASVEVMKGRRDEMSDRNRRRSTSSSIEVDRLHQSLEDLLELGRLDAGVALQDLPRSTCRAGRPRTALQQSHARPARAPRGGTRRGRRAHVAGPRRQAADRAAPW